MSITKTQLKTKLDNYTQAEEFFTKKLSEYSEKLSDNMKAKLWNEVYPIVKLAMEVKLKDGGFNRPVFNIEIADKVLFVLFGAEFQRMMDKLL